MTASRAWSSMSRSPVGPRPRARRSAAVIEVLGDPDDFGVDVEMMIRKHQLPRIFP
jgi:ribonuclease R